MSLTFLLIEDDEIERMKFARVMQKNNFNHRLLEAENGEEALKILEKKDSLPDIIFLDLNMPKMNGLEFLKILKSDTSLNYTPVVILSTSNNHNDLKDSYETGVAGYIVKPLKYEDYAHKIKCMIEYWSVNEFVNA
ncbi:response regulator [Aquimarina spongiae]|uniref:Response regulator receiver domain-containing protein n=1 Tax=Aquimarina spongiae TaxID=570521 RepID=A0A1M6J6E1_9FLAO|nr:response regulator [Aquimarina spongiae]SHJ42268.1 Response regulator receiver domain-containing protein [Aquimarina spongiae]